MPKNDDNPIKISNQALQPHGLYLRRVYQTFIDNSSGVEYNLLQLQKCQIVLVLNLTRANGSRVAHHTIGWDGKALLDHPCNIVIEEKDRSDKIHARKVFNELYPKETFSNWSKQAFAIAIAKLSNKNKEEMTSRRRKKKGRAATMGPKIN